MNIIPQNVFVFAWCCEFAFGCYIRDVPHTVQASVGKSHVNVKHTEHI